MHVQVIQQKVYEIRGQKVMLDFDLAELYEVKTMVLNQAVKRNIKRFPQDFMFQLSITEWDRMRSQFVTSSAEQNLMLSQFVMSSQKKRNVSNTLYAVTEQGVSMLSGILQI